MSAPSASNFMRTRVREFEMHLRTIKCTTTINTIPKYLVPGTRYVVTGNRCHIFRGLLSTASLPPWPNQPIDRAFTRHSIQALITPWRFRLALRLGSGFGSGGRRQVPRPLKTNRCTWYYIPGARYFGIDSSINST